MSLDIPDDETLLGWTLELLKECEGSRQERINNYAMYRQFYFNGGMDQYPAPYNKLYPHIDTLGSYLYSPKNVSFVVEYDHTEDEDAWQKGAVAAAYLSRIFTRRKFNFAAEAANTWGLVKGSTFIKVKRAHGGLRPELIHPEHMCVKREDVNGLDEQEAFFHTTYMTEGQFRILVRGHPKEAEILRKVQPTTGADIDPMRQSMFKQIIVGPTNPIQVGGTPSGQTVGQVNWLSAYTPFVPPDVARNLIRLDEGWIRDAKRDDWTTLQVAQGSVIIEGDSVHRNLGGVIGQHPFSQFCPNFVSGYFWGLSEIVPLAPIQQGINATVEMIDGIEELQAQPPLAFLGGVGFNQEKYQALMAPGGYFSEEAPGAKLENMAPKLPDGSYQNLINRIDWFNDVSGLTSTLRGENQPGVRAGGHAETLVRTSSPRIIDRALQCESNVADLGETMLRIEQVANPRPFGYGAPGEDVKKKKFLLEQLPKDFFVTVDSHSSSPAFSEEGMQKAFALFRAGAITAADLIRLTHPPREDSLIAAAERRDRQKAEFLAKNPDIAKKQMSKGR